MASGEKKQYCDLLTPVACDGCGGQNDVINYCLQCNGNICDGCKPTHCNTRLTRNHIILHRTHPEVVKARRSKKIYCSQHTGKEYVIYCMECSQPCCVTCITDKHKGHTFTDLEKMILQTESEIDELIHDLETNLIPISEEAMSTLDEEITSYKRNMDKIKESAKERIQTLIQQLGKAEEIFLTEVDTLEKNFLQIMETKKRELKENMEKLKSAAATGKSAPVDASLLLLKDEISTVSTMKPSRITCPGNLSLNVSSFLLPTVNDIIGSISIGAEKILCNEATHAQPQITRANSLDNTKVDVTVLTKIDGIFGRAIMNHHSNQTWIFNEDTKSMCVYDEHFTRTRNINIGFICNDMAMDGSHDVIATDITNNRIVRISSSGSITQICSTDPLTPGGICVNNKQQIVVGGVEGLLSQSKLVVYSSDGSSVLQDIKYDQSGERLFTGWINRVRQTVSGDYVVANGSRIICLSTEWKVKWKYKFGPRCDVYALYCDMYNNILVGDRDKDKIVMLNKDGELIRTLLTKEDGICEPWSLGVDSKGRLWIGQKKNVLISTYLK